MLSVLGMTYGDEEKLETLKYRLLAKSEDLGSWGHEYVRHLALEIGQEYQNRLNAEKDVQDLIDLALSLVRRRVQIALDEIYIIEADSKHDGLREFLVANIDLVRRAKELLILRVREEVHHADHIQTNS